MMTVELQPEKMIVRVLDQGKGFELTEVPDPWPKKTCCARPAAACS